MSEQPDPVQAAFEAMQDAAKKRGSTPLPPRKAASRSRGLPPRIGRPTGRDGRRRRRPLDVDSIGAVLGDEFSKRGWEKDIAGGWVFGHWDELVGEKIAQHTRVEMIKDKKLFITCDSTAWATNLRMMQRQILQVIAEKVGPNIIVELKIFGPRAPSWRKGPLHVKGRGPRDTYG
ncbi:DciA family protein [Corynebacterium sp. YIM 101645]|uniref:DciA family protein n=1 Tax=Corynebacterium lemuris TaxID=1859292 RepID=A0ABT2FXN9_9CORY|nr:DciA family protein [Corynebacterium lemuris]MCS5480001.1 DciA family protein [Corynebacterium lemuris]